QLWLDGSVLDSTLFGQLKLEMEALNQQLAKTLYGRVMGYFKGQAVDGSKLAAQATNVFWQLCERDAQTLVDHCTQDAAAIKRRQRLRQQFSGYAQRAYDQFC